MQAGTIKHFGSTVDKMGYKSAAVKKIDIDLIAKKLFVNAQSGTSSFTLYKEEGAKPVLFIELHDYATGTPLQPRKLWKWLGCKQETFVSEHRELKFGDTYMYEVHLHELVEVLPEAKQSPTAKKLTLDDEPKYGIRFDKMTSNDILACFNLIECADHPEINDRIAEIKNIKKNKKAA